jgi:hypothetical protein
MEKQIIEFTTKVSGLIIKYKQSFTVVEPLLVIDNKLINPFLTSSLISRSSSILKDAKYCHVFKLAKDEPDCKVKISLDGHIYF